MRFIRRVQFFVIYESRTQLTLTIIDAAVHTYVSGIVFLSSQEFVDVDLTTFPSRLRLKGSRAPCKNDQLDWTSVSHGSGRNHKLHASVAAFYAEASILQVKYFWTISRQIDEGTWVEQDASERRRASGRRELPFRGGFGPK